MGKRDRALKGHEVYRACEVLKVDRLGNPRFQAEDCRSKLLWRCPISHWRLLSGLLIRNLPYGKFHLTSVNAKPSLLMDSPGMKMALETSSRT